MARRLTPIQRAWQQEVARIERFIKRNTPKGYEFKDVIPPRPKRITQTKLKVLRSLRGMRLYELSTFTTPTGEHISGAEARRREKGVPRQATSETPPTVSTVVLGNLQEVIDKWRPDPRWSDQFAQIKEDDKNRAKNILQGAINNLGVDVVAMNVERNAATLKDLIWDICYGQSGVKKDGGDYMNSRIQFFTALVYDRPLTMEQNLEITRLAEENENS